MTHRAASADAQALPPYAPLASEFLVDRGLVFLNHGSYGAVPQAVLSAQQAVRERCEQDPVAWFGRDLEGQMDAAREAIARFIDAPPEQIAPVMNATAGVSTVVASLALTPAGLRPGDELLTTSHEYNACNNALRLAQRRHDLMLVTVPFPWPVSGPEQVISALCAGVTPNTRLALVSHITSPSGITLPAAQITRALLARARELRNDRLAVLIDGAHAPGYLSLSVRELANAGASYFTGNLHKWVCGPKGSAVLWVSPELAEHTPPLIVSHGLNAARPDRSRFRLLQDYVGSADYSPWLCAPVAIQHVPALLGPQGTWQAVRAACQAMLAGALAAIRAELTSLDDPVAGTLACPPDMIGQMAALRLPDHPNPPPVDPAQPYDPLFWALYRKWRIQVPIYGVLRPDATRARVVRISAALYNHPDQYRYLARALRAEILAERATTA
jgi:isopenicillin-N epimerase